jgi:uncharacterized protein (TIGR03435 family)
MDHRQFAMLAVVILSGTAAIAQDRPASPEPAFDVASVKLNPNDNVPEGLSLQADGVRFTGFRVRTLITMAYRSEGIQRFDQLVGGPSWIAIDRFDIVAKVRGDANAQAAVPNWLPAMLRTLLRDRFRLRIHSATRRMPAYALVVARRDRRLGPQLRESTLECPPANTAPPAANADPDRWCGIRAAGGVITGHAVSASLLAGNLSGYPTVDRFVTDRTGLTARYDFRLEYSPAFAEPGEPVPNAGASLFTALTEQLGLKLQPESVALPVLVIDNVEKPTPD